MVNRYRWKTNAITAAGAAIIGITTALILISTLRFATNCLIISEHLWKTIALLAAAIIVLPIGIRLINEANDRREFRKNLNELEVGEGDLEL